MNASALTGLILYVRQSDGTLASVIIAADGDGVSADGIGFRPTTEDNERLRHLFFTAGLIVTGKLTVEVSP